LLARDDDNAVTLKQRNKSAELIHDTRDMPYTHKGETTLIQAVTG